MGNKAWVWLWRMDSKKWVLMCALKLLNPGATLNYLLFLYHLCLKTLSRASSSLFLQISLWESTNTLKFSSSWRTVTVTRKQKLGRLERNWVEKKAMLWRSMHFPLEKRKSFLLWEGRNVVLWKLPLSKLEVIIFFIKGSSLLFSVLVNDATPKSSFISNTQHV